MSRRDKTLAAGPDPIGSPMVGDRPPRNHSMDQSLRILHLEDNPLDTELIKETLEEAGISCHLLRVETRGDFLEALERGCFDILLSDYSLPTFDGLSAMAIVREHYPEIPFLIITGTLGEEVVIETLKSGATDYVLKQHLARLA